MSRIRSIKPQWLDDERMGMCSDTARMVSVALITIADDHGNGRAHSMYLGSRIWPYSEDLTEVSRRLSASLRELAECGFLRLYEVKKQKYFNILNWYKHQRIDNAGKPLVPLPACANKDPSANSPRTRRELPRTSANSPLDKERDKDKEREEERGRSPNSNSEQIQNQGLDADLNQVQVSEHEPPTPSHDPSPCRPDSVAEVYRDCSKNRDVGDMSPCWTTRQRDAISTMSSWCGGDLGKLEAELKALHAADSANKKPWLIHQPAHVWAERLGTAPDPKSDPNSPESLKAELARRDAKEVEFKRQAAEREKNKGACPPELKEALFKRIAKGRAKHA